MTLRRLRPPRWGSQWAEPGAPAVLETADVVIMADDLSKLPYALRLSRKANAIIKTNLAFSVAAVIRSSPALLPASWVLPAACWDTRAVR